MPPLPAERPDAGEAVTLIGRHASRHRAVMTVLDRIATIRADGCRRAPFARLVSDRPEMAMRRARC